LSKHGILSDLLVIDLTTNIAGPFTTHILSSLGASVLKVERVAGGDDARMMFPTFGDKSAYFSLLNSSKKSIALDIRTPEGSAILRRLISRADVLVENFRPQVSRRLGLSWTEVKKMNEGIIHVSISAYGQRGPERDRSGYDALLQARTGIMSVTGNAGEPPVRVGVSILDLSAGLWAALGTRCPDREEEDGQRHVGDDLALRRWNLVLWLSPRIQTVDGKQASAQGDRSFRVQPLRSLRDKG
jgi:crotonobetainyl-CoA:carnitine CoA-transferase CaiB-like acyl-CoA transferase